MCIDINLYGVNLHFNAFEPLCATTEILLYGLSSTFIRFGSNASLKTLGTFTEKLKVTIEEKVPKLTSQLFTEFLNNKGIDTRTLIFKKNLTAKDDSSYEGFGDSELINAFVIFIPWQAIQRIEKEGKLKSEDRFSILHEWGHNVHHDSIANHSAYFPLKKGVVRLLTYSVSAFALSYFTPLFVAHTLATGIADKSGELYYNMLRHKTEYLADGFAAKSGNDIYKDGIITMQNTMEQYKGKFQEGNTRVTECGDLRFPFQETHPAYVNRIRMLNQICTDKQRKSDQQTESQT